MLRLLPCLLAILCLQSNAQFADAGSGVLRDKIWWFDWTNFTPSNGVVKTFTTTEGLTVTISCSNVTGQTLQPKVMNTWSGAILHVLYNFTNASINPALYSDLSTTSSHLTLTITATRNGNPTAFTFIAADAEASTIDELTKLQTSGTPWQTIEFYRNSSQTSNPVAGCNSTTVTISDTYGNAPVSGQNPIIATDANNTGILNVDVTLDKKTFGGMAVAFGIFAPADRGDLPVSYGNVQHALSYTKTNACNFQMPLPSLIQSSALKMGTLPGDADGQQTSDDNATGSDEDAVASFPAYTASGNYSVTIPVTNTTASNAFVTGWFDFDNNGSFSVNERVTATVAPNTASVTITWTTVPNILPLSSAFAFRFRYSSDLASVMNAEGYAPDGEAEDYLVPLVCNLTLAGGTDISMCTGKSFQFNITGASDYVWSPGTGLSATNIGNPTTTTTQNTTYIVTGSSGGCKGSDTMQVTVVQSPNFNVTPGTASVCRDQAVSLVATGGDTYVWTDQQNNVLGNASSLAFTPTASGSVNVVITNTGCQLSDTIAVPFTVNQPPVISVTKSNDVDCSNAGAVLTASGGLTYKWQAKEGISNLNIANPSVSPKQPTTYVVTVTDVNGCATKDSITVKADFTQGIANYLMPTAFTPNGDGKNDCFGLKYNAGVTDFELSIYSRLGALIFQTKDASRCWDGTFKGVQQNSGTYVYQMRVAGTCSTGYSKGTVVLIR